MTGNKNHVNYLIQKTTFSKCFSFFLIFFIVTIISVISSIQIACDIMCVQHVQKQPLEVFFKKGVLEDFADLTGKHLCWSLFLIKLQGWGFNFIKMILQQICFPVKLAKFWRTPILKNICGRLLIKWYVIKYYSKK